MSKRRKKRLPASEVSAFCEQMALLLKGGIPIYECTCILYQENDQREEKKRLKGIAELVKKKVPLYEVLGQMEAFPSYMVHMVKIGETTGRLGEVMDSLAAYYEREQKVRENIRHVVIYPLMLFIILGMILLVLVLKIFPIFKDVFYGLDTSRAKTAELMMKVSLELGKSIAIVVLTLIVLIIAIVLVNHIEEGHTALRKAANYIPYIREVKYKLGIAKFVSVMSIMIGSGLTSKESLELASGMAEHPLLKKRIMHCLRSVRNNGTLEDSLRDSGLLTGKSGRMMKIGARAGSLDTVLEKIREKCEEEADQSLYDITSVVESVLVITLSVVIGVVLVAIMLPLISIISTIG